MESQPQNPKFRNNPENLDPWVYRLFYRCIGIGKGFQYELL